MGAPDNRFKPAMVLRHGSSGVSPHNTGRSPAHAASAWSLRHVHPGMACSSTTALFARPRKPEDPPASRQHNRSQSPRSRAPGSQGPHVASPVPRLARLRKVRSVQFDITATDQQISLERSRSFEQALSDMPRPSALQEVSPHHPCGRRSLTFTLEQSLRQHVHPAVVVSRYCHALSHPNLLLSGSLPCRPHTGVQGAQENNKLLTTHRCAPARRAVRLEVVTRDPGVVLGCIGIPIKGTASFRPKTIQAQRVPAILALRHLGRFVPCPCVMRDGGGGGEHRFRCPALLSPVFLEDDGEARGYPQQPRP